MKFVGIDLSLNSTGIVVLCSEDIEKMNYCLIQSSLKGEERLDKNASDIINFLTEMKPDAIGIEDLSYNSISSSKDEIAANFWRVRCEIKRFFPTLPVSIIPVLSWRSPLFNKAERDQLKFDTAAYKALKKEVMATKDKGIKAELLLGNEDLINKANIKYLTLKKLPQDVQEVVECLGYTKGAFDISDAWHIANHLRKNS
jgi:hypothetical protein